MRTNLTRWVAITAAATGVAITAAHHQPAAAAPPPAIEMQTGTQPPIAVHPRSWWAARIRNRVRVLIKRGHRWPPKVWDPKLAGYVAGWVLIPNKRIASRSTCAPVLTSGFICRIAFKRPKQKLERVIWRGVIVYEDGTAVMVPRRLLKVAALAERRLGGPR